MPYLLPSFFNPIEHPEPIKMGEKKTIRRLRNTPLIINANQVNTLLDRSDCFTQIIDKPYKILRFLLKVNGELVFGAEGTPRKHIPAHYQMADMNLDDAQCLCAGNAFFDENNKLCMLDHKSGDFRPSFDSLQFTLMAFLKSGMPLNSIITIIKLNSLGGEVQRYPVRTQDIVTSITPMDGIAAGSVLVQHEDGGFGPRHLRSPHVLPEGLIKSVTDRPINQSIVGSQTSLNPPSRGQLTVVNGGHLEVEGGCNPGHVQKQRSSFLPQVLPPSHSPVLQKNGQDVPASHTSKAQQPAVLKIEAQQRFQLQLDLLKEKMDDLARRREKHCNNLEEFKVLNKAWDAANTLHTELDKAGTAYFYHPTPRSYQTFENTCNKLIDDAHVELDKHRGWSELIVNLAIGILTVGAGLLVKGVINLAMNKSFFHVHQTKSSELLDDIKTDIQNAAPSA